MTLDEAAFWRNQGITAARQGDRIAARTALERAIGVDPADTEAWFWIAAVQSDPRLALTALERVLTLEPSHARARQGMAAIRDQLGLDASVPPAAVAPSPVAPAPPPAPVVPDASSPFAPAASPFSSGGVSYRTPAPGSGPQEVPSPAPSPFAAAPSPFGTAPAPAAVSAGNSLEDRTRRGIAAAQAGRPAEARALLMDVVEEDERNEAAWYALSTVLDDPEDITVALENTLHLNPGHTAAATALRQLQTGELPGAKTSASPAPDAERYAERMARRGGATLFDSVAAVSDWANVTVATTPTEDNMGAEGEYAHLVGQVMGKKYRVVALFPSQGSMLLLATNIKNGTYLLIKPESPTFSKSARQAATSGFEHKGQAYVISNIGLNGLTMRAFVGAIGCLAPPQVVDYGLRLIREARRGRRP
ncbi:MAG TPA: hypothetical protein VM536_04285, partial [Chloroflexia bacterium]|nr:hypothetical protein [Chloroflexia bacterium]